MANSCAEFRKNFRFSSIFFKIHNFGTHIFLYVYTTNTQLPHMSYSGSQIHNTCYIHVKSCVYMCCVQGSTLLLIVVLAFHFEFKLRCLRNRVNQVLRKKRQRVTYSELADYETESLVGYDSSSSDSVFSI